MVHIQKLCSWGGFSRFKKIKGDQAKSLLIQIASHCGVKEEL